MLEKLYMISTKLSSSAAIKLFTALSKSNKLRALWIMHNNITDEACDTIIMAMKNNSLVKLYMYSNRISTECAQLIVQALQHNNTLQYLYLPSYSNDVQKRIRLSVEKVNKKRESCECQVKLRLIFTGSYIVVHWYHFVTNISCYKIQTVTFKLPYRQH